MYSMLCVNDVHQCGCHTEYKILTSIKMLHYGAIDYHILQVAENTRFQIISENCLEVRSTEIKTKHILIRICGKVL